MGNSRKFIANPVVLRIIIGASVLFIGVASMLVLASMKKPPAETTVQENKIKVETMITQPENVGVFIKGFGEVVSLKTVSISPEVSGKILRIHPKLEVGQIIDKGQTLFEIDSQDYLATYEETLVSVLQMQNTINRLKKEFEISKSRFKTLERNRDLSKAEFQRMKRLYSKNKIGTQSDVDSSEKAYNSAVDQVDQMNQSLETFPLSIKEAEYSLRSANARLTRAETNLRRCAVKAPFTGRLKTVSIEAGQYVSPGMSVLTLVDDSTSELHIPLDGVDARQWLQFDKDETQPSSAWFAALKPLPVEIRWTEDTDGHFWEGILDRVIAYDKQTRTLTIAVRVEKPISLTNGTLPLVEGMFCEVSIPGKMMRNVIRLPRWAVSFRNTVYIAEKNRLKTVPVKVARIQNDEVFVSDGLSAGDRVITTRLVDPLENSLLEFISP